MSLSVSRLARRLAPVGVLSMLLCTSACKDGSPSDETSAASSSATGAPSSSAKSPTPSAEAGPDDECVGGLKTRSVTFTSVDGLKVHATSANPCGGARGPLVVLVHQMCRDRAEWSAAGHDWVQALHARRIATLAMDLRGHGKSVVWPDGKSIDLCAQIREPGVQKLYAPMVQDVKAAIRFARAELGAKSVAVVGSSIGANSALVAFSEDRAVRAVVALSPGKSYRGIEPGPPLEEAGDRPVILVAAKDDQRSAESVRALEKANTSVQATVVAKGGHGNAIFRTHPGELSLIVSALADLLADSR